jgi:spore coat protein U-like protein
MMKKAFCLVVTMMMILSLSAVSAYAAGRSTGNMNVTFTRSSAVTVTITDLDFGTAAVGSWDETTGTGASAGDVTVNAENTLAYKIGLDAGGNLNAGSRRVTDGTNFLNYSLDSAGTAWGTNGIADTTGAVAFAGADDVDDTGNGADQAHAVGGDVTTAAGDTAGLYVDTVVVIVEW